MLDEVVTEIKNDSLGILVFWEIWGAKVVLLMVGATKSLKASGIPILGVKSGKEITRASSGLTTGEPWKSVKKST